jgi:imidazoleglycerol-phosphate dehydratase
MIERKTKETRIKAEVKLLGNGVCEVKTPIAFLNHMLSTLCFYSKMDLTLEAEGDLVHHIVEDVAIVLGAAINNALGERSNIKRFGFAKIPMDDAIAEVTVDLVRRTYVVTNLKLTSPVEGIEPELFNHFLRSLAQSANFTLHVNVAYGEDNHHKVEATFKALGIALREAWSPESRLVSTKGEV